MQQTDNPAHQIVDWHLQKSFCYDFGSQLQVGFLKRCVCDFIMAFFWLLCHEGVGRWDNTAHLGLGLIE